MAWDAGTIVSGTPVAAFSQKIKDLITAGPNLGNWSFVKNIPAGSGLGTTGSTTYSGDLFRCRGATTLYERVIQKNLGSLQNTTDATSFVMAGVTPPPANRFITVCVVNTKATAADDPTSVTLDGSNAPTFTKIKSQASGGSPALLKMTLWIGKTGSLAATGTNLTVAFGANTQTGCMVQIDEWQGVDLTLGATALDPTGAAQIGIQAVGNAGTVETAQTATLAAYLGPQSCAICYAAQTASASSYAAIENGWTLLNTTGDTILATPTAHLRGMWRNDKDDTTPLFTAGTPTSQTDWVCVAFEFQRKVNTASITDANDAGLDWYMFVVIPTTDNGTLQWYVTCFEDYDGNELCRRGATTTQSSFTPIPPGGWRDNTLNLPFVVPGWNPSQNQILNTTGFQYWIKMTKNGICFGTRIGSAEASNALFLLDSFVTNAVDLPLVQWSTVAAQNSFTRLPGVGANTATSLFMLYTQGWTEPVIDALTSNAVNAQDLWASQKIHAARIAISHLAGRTAAQVPVVGYMRGLVKTDYLCIAVGGTVQLGDTMTISGNTWTCIAKGQFGSTPPPTLYVFTRAL